MTIDERLDRLTGRHEALTQTVELLLANQLKVDERMAQLMETMNRLANVVISHEERIDRLEDRH